MKYHYKKPDNWVGAGQLYLCDHPMYKQCTLFKSGPVGLAIVQERFNKKSKVRYWTSVDPWIAGDIYMSEGFEGYFVDHSRKADENGLYPTVTLRKIMWALRLKPLPKEDWEKWN